MILFGWVELTVPNKTDLGCSPRPKEVNRTTRLLTLPSGDPAPRPCAEEGKASELRNAPVHADPGPSLGQASVFATPTGQLIPFGPIPQYPPGSLSGTAGVSHVLQVIFLPWLGHEYVQRLQAGADRRAVIEMLVFEGGPVSGRR
jgi:hypothetical protein